MNTNSTAISPIVKVADIIADGEVIRVHSAGTITLILERDGDIVRTTHERLGGWSQSTLGASDTIFCRLAEPLDPVEGRRIAAAARAQLVR